MSNTQAAPPHLTDIERQDTALNVLDNLSNQHSEAS